jgi:hypothetical protein
MLLQQKQLTMLLMQPKQKVDEIKNKLFFRIKKASAISFFLSPSNKRPSCFVKALNFRFQGLY